MEFKAVQNIQYKKDKAAIVLEATNPNHIVGEHTVDIEGQSMEISLLTDKIIEGNNLQEVTNPILFKNGVEPTDDGLFSPIIFGTTAKERKRTHAYIDLHRKFFHPYIFEILKKLQRNIETVAAGRGVWYITPEGKLEEITNEDDQRYNPDNTGIAWLIDNFHKLSFKESKSDSRSKMLKYINSLSDDEIFISKWIIIPIFYRDVDGSTGMKQIPEINNLYVSLLQNTRSYENDIISVTKHLTLFRIQQTLVAIRKFGQSLIEKKNGALQKSVIGKSIDRGARGVISVPSLNGCDVPNDCIVDITHSGIPLSYCIVAGYPFMIKWLTEFFEDTFRNKTTIPACRKNKNGEYEFEYVEIKDQTEVFTQSYIDKKLEMFKQSFGFQRFETIKIQCADGTEAELYFPGKGYSKTPGDPRANTIGNRPLTWTDLIYLAAVETLSDKHCYITRYPLEDYFGIFPSRVAVLSTIKTTPVIINGKVYEHYPIVDLSLPKDQISRQFIDTISISNLFLDAIGGD